ncbi:MAG: hypothetical protein ACTSYA_03730 [Candidatus Kariarchaeaceae archaeon]
MNYYNIEEEEEEERHIPADLKEELLEKTEEEHSGKDITEMADILEGKIPTKPKDEEEKD